MRRAPLRRERAPQVIQELPTIRQLTFAPLPYDTHPIDTYDGPQGWGPFYGAWTPWDFRDPAADIAYTYGHGESNEWQFSPDYDVITLFADHSLEWDWNTSYDSAATQQFDEQQRAYTSTAANAIAPRGPSMLSKLRDALSGASSGGGE